MTDLTAQQEEFDIEGTPGACYAHKVTRSPNLSSSQL